MLINKNIIISFIHVFKKIAAKFKINFANYYSEYNGWIFRTYELDNHIL